MLTLFIDLRTYVALLHIITKSEHSCHEHLAYYIKGKVHPITWNEGTEGEYRYISTLSLTSAVDGSRWLTPRPCRFTSEKGPVPIA